MYHIFQFDLLKISYKTCPMSGISREVFFVTKLISNRDKTWFINDELSDEITWRLIAYKFSSYNSFRNNHSNSLLVHPSVKGTTTEVQELLDLNYTSTGETT